MSIKEKLKEIKGGVKNGFSFESPMRRKAFLTLFVILTTSAFFGLERLSGLKATGSDIEIEFPKGQEAAIGVAFATTSMETKILLKTSGRYVASKNGTKYYLNTCGSVKRISEKNKIWFDTKEEAERAGYAPASNCKGM